MSKLTREDRIITLSMEIQAARGELAELESEFRQLIGETTVSAPPKPRKAAKLDAGKAEKPAGEKEPKPRSEGLPTRILELLAKHNDIPFEAKAVIKDLGADAQQVRTTLSRLVKAGKVASPEKGLYQHKPTDEKQE